MLSTCWKSVATCLSHRGWKISWTTSVWQGASPNLKYLRLSWPVFNAILSTRSLRMGRGPASTTPASLVSPMGFTATPIAAAMLTAPTTSLPLHWQAASRVGTGVCTTTSTPTLPTSPTCVKWLVHHNNRSRCVYIGNVPVFEHMRL